MNSQNKTANENPGDGIKRKSSLKNPNPFQNRRNLFKTKKHLYKIAFDSNSNYSVDSSTSADNVLFEDSYVSIHPDIQISETIYSTLKTNNFKKQIQDTIEGNHSDDVWFAQNDLIYKKRIKTSTSTSSCVSFIENSTSTETNITEDEFREKLQNVPSLRLKILNNKLMKKPQKLVEVETEMQLNLDLVSKAKISDMPIKCILEKS